MKIGATLYLFCPVLHCLLYYYFTCCFITDWPTMSKFQTEKINNNETSPFLNSAGVTA